MTHFIKKLIAEGEHQLLDFKFEISDFRKIARTLVAFSNTDGGRLLIGVKDNGAIAGVRSEEEFFMIEGAARLYCRPEIPFRIKEWEVDGKRILEVIISPGSDLPYTALDENGKWLAYIRQADQNFLANPVQLKLWKFRKIGRNALVKFTGTEKFLLNYLQNNPDITLSAFRNLTHISRSKAEGILVNMLMLEIVQMIYTQKEAVYKLSPDYQDKLPPEL